MPMMRTFVQRSRPGYWVLPGSGGIEWLTVDNADRIIDWSKAGVWDGTTKGIPDTSGWTVLNVVIGYGADPTGVSDSTTAIQNAINAAGANTIIYFPAGTYRYTTLNCYGKSRLLLKGAGPTRTFLTCYGSGEYSAIRMEGGDAVTGPYAISFGATKGSSSIVVSSVAGLAVGDVITVYPNLPSGFPGTAGVERLPFESTYPPRISEYGNPEVAPNYYGWSYWDAPNARTGHGSNCQWYEGFGQLVEISGINGNTLSFDRPLYYDYSAYSPRIVKRGPFINLSGIEDMSIEFNNAATAGGHLIRFWYAKNCWVRNCELAKTRAHGIYARYSRSCEFVGNYAHHGVSYVGGASYLFSFADYNSDHLVYDNIARHGRHHIVFEGGGQGCVIAYNYSLDTCGDTVGWLFSDLGLHGRHPYMNLWEGNYAGGLEFDSIHGSSSHNVVLRNAFSGRGVNDNAPGGYTNARICVKIAKASVYHSLLGNVLGYSGCAADGYTYSHYEQYLYDRYMEYIGATGDTASLVSINPQFSLPWPYPEATMLRHGNYDYVNGAVTWNPGIASHAIPDSLYLSAKPSWFGLLDWPPIGPDVTGQKKDIPAKVRWDAYVVSDDKADLFTPGGFVINHLNTDITDIPDAYITAAKANLHIAYGTASHGSQIVFGIAGIDAFLGTGTKYAANNGGTGGALDWRAYVGNFAGLNIATSIELDHNQSTCHACWDTATRAYLPAHPEVNVIMWMWCWGLTDGTVWAIDYLARMEQLELDFPAVTFVYMTGRTMAAGAYVTGDQVGNAYIRNYCIANNKVLYDFNDIESYDPDGVYYGYPKAQDEAGAYDSNNDGVRDANWMTTWQAAHPTLWFNCESPHSYPITANQKAYAAWHLWARLAGWGGPS
jgi:hypothetical protein